MSFGRFFIPNNYILAAKTFVHSRRCPYAYVIAGLGRCGTTLLYDTVRWSAHLRPNRDFLVNFDRSASYQKGQIYKTHDRPPEQLAEHVKVVFMFGNPMNAALSALHGFDGEGPSVCKRHYRHMHSPHYHEHEHLCTKDTLLLAEHFAAWHKQQTFSFISVRYEALWEAHVREALENYLAVRLNLPPPKPRSTDWTTHERREELLATYGPLNKLIVQAADVKVWSRSP